jgi:hypothetical protein
LLAVVLELLLSELPPLRETRMIPTITAARTAKPAKM